MPSRRAWLSAAAAVVFAGALAAALLAGSRGPGATQAGTDPGQTGANGAGTSRAQASPAGAGAGPVGASPAAAGFGWLRPRAAPAGWLRARLPGHSAVLAYPRWLRPEAGDAGTVTVGRDSATGAVLAYLNVTPRQGGETLRDWAAFRLDHLREDGDEAVHLDASSPAAGFRGGRGRCVIDDYVTRAHHNHYRELACFVRSANGASVLVAATSASEWQAYGGVLEQVVDAYRAS